MITAHDLTLVPEFSDLSEEQREWLATQFEELNLAEGEAPFEQDASADHMMVVFEGALQIFVQRSGAWRLFDTFRAGRISGILPYSRMERFTGRSSAIEPTRMGMLHKDRFPEVLYRLPILGQRLISLMSDRVRSSARADQEREKMLALGKLSAGLSHELNNPAAAVRRAAEDLKVRMDAFPSVVARLARHGLSPEKINPAGGYCRISGNSHAAGLSAMEMADREDAVLDWLEDHGVEDAWQSAPTLAEAGVTVEDLELALAEVPAGAIGDVVAWMEHSLGADRLLIEIGAAASRISDLVGSVKSYSHMDRSPEKQPVNLATGIENTLTMLGHKLRKKSIDVQRDLPVDLPTVPGHPGEINQVWTNIIDNAVDAMDDGGSLRISGSVAGPTVAIHIADSGHGIPPDILPHIFEPFYTTKDVGEGTGLGLDIAHRIIAEQHAGDIDVESGPEGTTFSIRLPLASAVPA